MVDELHLMALHCACALGEEREWMDGPFILGGGRLSTPTVEVISEKRRHPTTASATA